VLFFRLIEHAKWYVSLDGVLLSKPFRHSERTAHKNGQSNPGAFLSGLLRRYGHVAATLQ
jgi:hypothetical protein